MLEKLLPYVSLLALVVSALSLYFARRDRGKAELEKLEGRIEAVRAELTPSINAVRADLMPRMETIRGEIGALRSDLAAFKLEAAKVYVEEDDLYKLKVDLASKWASVFERLGRLSEQLAYVRALLRNGKDSGGGGA